MKHIKFLGAVISTIGLVAGVTASPATAITFSQGDRFTGSAFFQVDGDLENGDLSTLSFDFLDANGATGGTTGNFGIDPFTAVGAFQDYTTPGGAISANNVIQDTSFGDGLSIANFLSYDDGAGGLDEWSIDYNNINVMADERDGNLREISLSGMALFRGENTTTGTGGFQAIIRIDQTTNRAQLDFEAEAVPEPLTLLGTGIAAGFVGLFKRQSDKRKQDQA